MKNAVGPILRMGDEVDQVIAAIEDDNPDTEILVEDHSGYVRIHASSFLKVTRGSLEAAAGQPIPLSSLEPAIAGFAGRMRYVGDDELHWFLDRKD